MARLNSWISSLVFLMAALGFAYYWQLILPPDDVIRTVVGDDFRIVADDFHGVQVVDYRGYRSMIIDGSCVAGGLWIIDGVTSKQPIFQYTLSMAAGISAYSPIAAADSKGSIEEHTGEPSKRMLMLGLGSGGLPLVLRDEMRVTAVELRPSVAQYAREYFHLPGSVRVIVGDAVAVVNRTWAPRRFHALVVDLFTGGAAIGDAARAFTSGWLSQVRSKLMHRTGHLVVINFVGPYCSSSAAQSSDCEDAFTRRVLGTIRRSFPAHSITAILDQDPQGKDLMEYPPNIMVFACFHHADGCPSPAAKGSGHQGDERVSPARVIYHSNNGDERPWHVHPSDDPFTNAQHVVEAQADTARRWRENVLPSLLPNQLMR